MTESSPRKKFRFIPYRKTDIIDMCIDDHRLGDREESFRVVCDRISDLFHFKYHRIVEALKNRYAPRDPDADTLVYRRDLPATSERFVDLLGQLLEKANYERISNEQIEQALTQSSLLKISLHVDFTDFSEVLLFSRGESIHRENVPGWLGLFPKTVEFLNFDRVMVYLRFREDFDEKKYRLPLCRSGSTVLKLFRNVPGNDLEMLFPNTHIRMRLIDKLIIGVPALISGSVVLFTKLGASLVILGSMIGFWLGVSSEPVELNKTVLLALLAGFVALTGFLWKQFSTFKNRKLSFMQDLTQNLYFKNLDNNAGVFHRIADDAVEEECKETILAYYFLRISDTPMTREELDRTVEDWMERKWSSVFDFEVDDAVGKLLDLKIATEDKGLLSAVPLEDAERILKNRWINVREASSPD